MPNTCDNPSIIAYCLCRRHNLARSNATHTRQVQTKRQDKLLFVGLHILINLAEEVSTERKMVNIDES